MEDYPVDLMAFEAQFATEAACRDYLQRVRWPEGFRGPRCGHDKAWTTARHLCHCAQCAHEVSLTAGTIFQDTRKPLRLWFRAMWYVTSQKNGASAMGLQRALGLGSYQTAWTWLHKLRRAMVRPGRDRLSGHVELDETYVGGPESGVVGRLTEEKALVLIAVEREGRSLGRTRLRVVESLSSECVRAFARDAIEPGSVIRTDGLSCYPPLVDDGYTHDRIVQKHHRESPSELLPGVHRIASLLKRWLLGTHQGAVGHRHLPYYLDEFAFRFNRRASRYRGKLFYRLLQQAVALEPTSYRELVAGAPVASDHNP